MVLKIDIHVEQESRQTQTLRSEPYCFCPAKSTLESSRGDAMLKLRNAAYPISFAGRQ